MSEIMIHFDENLDSEAVMEIEDRLNRTAGVNDCHIENGNMHMLAVTFDGSQLTSTELLHKVTDRAVHAQLVGL